MNSSSRSIDYKKLFQSLSAAYIVFDVNDPTFTILEENEAHASIAMSKRSEAIGKPLLDVFPDNSKSYKETGKSDLIESLRKVIRTKKKDVMPDLHYDIPDEKGKFEQRYWSVEHHPVVGENGEVVAVYQATQDITDKRRAEKELYQTQYQLKQALSNGAIGTWSWDIVRGVVTADENLATLFGIDPTEARDGLEIDRFLLSIHKEDREKVSQEIGEALKNRENYESEYRTIMKDGTSRWVIARGRVDLDESGKPVSFPGVAVDITERKNAENNLSFLTKASSQFSASLDYRQTLSSIAGMVVPHLADWCTVDLLRDDGSIELVAIAHRDPEKVKWAQNLRTQQGPLKLSQPGGIQQVIKTGEPMFEPVITDAMLVAGAKDKTELELLRSLGFSSVIMVPMKIDHRTIGVITLVSTDAHGRFTSIDLETATGLGNRAALAVYNANLYQTAQQELEEREWLQEQLETANNILESRVKERTEQLQATNFGLEEEIVKRQKAETVLQNYSEDLARSNQELQDFAYVASHDLQEPLRKIQAFGDLLENEYKEQLGEGMEYLSRMRNAASRMSVLIEDLLSFSRVTTRAKEPVAVNLNVIASEVVGDLETKIDSTDGTVDLQSLPTVMADPTHMRQLLQNLIGNALKFHRSDVAPVVKVYADPVHSVDQQYTMYVSDNGIGFDEKYLDRIFAVFQRLHGRESYDGTGIGLAVCRKIVERYGGTITATSQKGEGSTFIIKLPVSKQKEQNK